MARSSKAAKRTSSAHERLHRLVDTMPESMLEPVGAMLEIFVHQSDHPAWAAMRRALVEQEFEDLYDDERQAIDEAYQEMKAGATLLPHEEVKRRWLEAK